MTPSAQRGAVVAAVDIGGTKIAAALVDSDGRVLQRARRPTPAGTGAGTGAAAGGSGAGAGAGIRTGAGAGADAGAGAGSGSESAVDLRSAGGSASTAGSASTVGPGAEVVLGAVLDAVAELSGHERWGELVGVGLGSAGPVDAAAGTVSPVNIPAWREFPLTAAVGRHPALAGLPVTLLGDGSAFAEAEHWLGAAAGYRHALCMVVSTGVGAGLVLDGAVHLGVTGNAGHLGHIVVDMNGEPCACGGRGCLEGIASGTAIARFAREAGWQPEGEDASAAAVAAAAERGDPIALAAFDRAGQALAAGIASTAALVEIEAVVIGGGVAQAAPLLFPPLTRHLETYAALPFLHGIRLHQARLGSDAGLIGAARAALRVSHP